MTMRKLEDKNVRKIQRSGGSYTVSIPAEMIDKLKWREKQKVVVKMKGKSIIIRDWR
jgi:antitoxin component of MazEF toxin-antitoxin module